jgi:hypothetical protein
MKPEPKPKKCRICSTMFLPRTSLQIVCSFECSIKHSEKKAEKKASKEWKERKSIMKEELKTFSDYAKALQKEVNEAVRIRDEGKECISCSTILNSKVKKFDAGHFYSVGAYPELRFKWKNNIHGQCVSCNQHKRGNYHEYKLKLKVRIGEERYQQLNSQKNKRSDLTVYDLKVLISQFKETIKTLKNDIQRNN